MEIRELNNMQTPAFGARFNKKGLTEVVNYAKETGQLQALDSALNKLLHANDGDILIIHGKTPDGEIYSNFTMGKKTVQNLTADSKTPAEASFKGILELGELGRKFRRLVGGDVKENLKAEDIISRYAK